MSHHTLTFVSHTHWDREWYQPFEEFRLRLVRLIDRLLDILDHDPAFRSYMLDGQTIVIDDYLAVRPDQEHRLQQHIHAGRLLIGPWHILPDEFLAGPESHIRNLLQGSATCARFGARMAVGNIPDPFGHISQLPQLLRGFDIDAAVFTRGVGDAPNEFEWAAPDGSAVLVLHQREGYGNAASMPADPQAFIARVRRIVDDLASHATTPHLLAMNGTDHEEPMAELPRLLEMARAALPELDIRHGTLPQFLADVRAAAPVLELRRGEMRDPSRFPLLPGVLSTRMWIKQRNTACETLLTAWAEPAAAIALCVGAPLALRNQASLLRYAWRYLMQNHPHDSICGCSVDQVHREMALRFDWVTQIGEELLRHNLASLATLADTSFAGEDPALLVFNPTAQPHDDLVTARVAIPEDAAGVSLVDAEGRTLPVEMREPGLDIIWTGTIPFGMLVDAADDLAGSGMVFGHAVRTFTVRRTGATLQIDIRVAPGIPPDLDAIRHGQQEAARLAAEAPITTAEVCVHRGAAATLTFVARNVPGAGYRSYAVRRCDIAPATTSARSPTTIENEYLQLTAETDGTLTLIDKTTGAIFRGLNCFVDEGDRGDEYNFCAVEEDTPVATPVAPPQIRVEHDTVRQSLEIVQTYSVPAGLGANRMQRGAPTVELPLVTHATLFSGARRVDFETTVVNQANDHRLRVLFPTPIQTDAFAAESHFDIIERAIDLPSDTTTWVEQPAATHPQRTWAGVSDGTIGLLLANRGLPEVEVRRGTAGVELALTLLRCVGWLSRDDLACRQGHAGPPYATPEAQCHGAYTFHYALAPHGADRRLAECQAHAFAAPLRTIATGAHPGTLLPALSFVRLEPAELVLSTIKPAEDGRGIIVRAWNSSDRDVAASVTFWTAPDATWRCNLAERDLAPAEQDGNTIRFGARSREIVTFRAVFATASSMAPLM
ncbi:MAG: hypothetical protein HXY39_15520 [Chloroflexi bacterium]|nr:hypothetical protein [Chloroflexota bacterium]